MANSSFVTVILIALIAGSAFAQSPTAAPTVSPTASPPSPVSGQPTSSPTASPPAPPTSLAPSSPTALPPLISSPPTGSPNSGSLSVAGSVAGAVVLVALAAVCVL